jgi:putative transposase
VGAVPLVPSRPVSQVLPSHFGPGRALARRLRRHSPADPRARYRRGRGHRPRRRRVGGPIHRDLLHCPGLRPAERARLRLLQRKLAHARKGSHRRTRVKTAIAKLRAREIDRRKDWAENLSTNIARRFDVIRVEDLRITNMTRSARGTLTQPGRRVQQKAGLNRAILASGWGLLVRRLDDKAPGRVERISPAFTSQRCSACGHVAADSRESQALFRCIACGYTGNADVNAAKNIAAGHAVTARGGSPLGGRMNREPQPLPLSA